MAGPSIGKTSLTLGAQWSALSKGLDKAYGDVKGFKGKVGALFSATGAKVAAGAGLVSGLAGAAGAAGLVSKALDTIEEKASLGAAARSFGLTAQQFTGIAGIAKSVGEDSREFIESMVTLGKVAAEGASGKGEVAAQFFADLNLNAQEFKNLRADQQFYKVFEALETISDPLVRVRTLMTAFGEDGGKYLLPLLGKSSVEIRSMGVAFATSNEQMAAFERTQQAVKAATASMDKAWQSVVVSLAPTVEAIATKIPAAVEGLKPSLKGLEENAVPIAHRITVGVAKLWDVVRSGAGVVTVVASKIALGFGGVATTIGKALSLLNHLNPASKAGDPTGLLDWAEELKAKARNVTDQGIGQIGMSASESAEKWFAGWQKDRAAGLQHAAAAVPRSPAPAGPGGPSAKDDQAEWTRVWGEVEAAEKAKQRAAKGRGHDDAPAKLERAASLLAAAAEQGSREEYSTRVRFQTGQLNVVKEQVAEQRKTTAAVDKATAAVKATAKPPVQFQVI